MNNLLVYRIGERATGIYSHLFGGFYQFALLPRLGKSLVAFLAIASFIFAAAELKTERRKYGKIAFALGLLNFIALTILLSEPYDELFIPLRHALHLAQNGIFSFNHLSRIDATGDFLPYYGLGFLHRWGIPLLEMALFQSLVSGMLCLFAVRAFWKHLEVERSLFTLLTVIMCHFPPLIFAAGTGFSTALFSATLLWSVYHLYFSKKPSIGLIICSILPLIRFEGIWFSFLFWLLYSRKILAHRGRRPLGTVWRLLILDGGSLLLPIALLSLYRARVYGSPVPLAFHYQSSVRSIEFLIMGLANLMADLWSSFAFAAILIIFNCLWVSKRTARNSSPDLASSIPYALSILCFVFPYYLAGGDTLPSFAARYTLPAALILIIFAADIAIRTFQDSSGIERRWLAGMGFGLMVSCLIIPSSLNALFAQVTGTRAGHGSFRIENLSLLGNHLGTTTRNEDTIAAASVSAVSYFANREALDLVGTTNPNLAAVPLAEKMRRRATVLEDQKPAFLLVENFVSNHLDLRTSVADLQTELLRICKQHEFWMTYYFGGWNALAKAKYQPFAILYANHVALFYFVAPEAVTSHIALLEKRRFRTDAIEENATPMGKPVSGDARRLSTSIPE